MTAELGIFNGHLLQHLLAALWFLFCWVGYTRYATWKGRDTACLASVLHLYREDWMRRLLLRDNRIADASVIGNLERNASFFASSTLIILAGILTLLGSTDRAVSVLADLPFVEEASRGLSELKLLCLAVVFVYAFFTFSWCMRQYNFAAILVGSAPMIGERNVGELERKSFAERAARVISLAANQFNIPGMKKPACAGSFRVRQRELIAGSVAVAPESVPESAGLPECRSTAPGRWARQGE